MNAAYNGRWERRGLVHIPIPSEPKSGRTPKPTIAEWTPDRLKAAHRRFFHGDRDLLTREGERLYQAERKRQQRAGAMSPGDRKWAEKNAVKSSWELDTRTNRCASVANTT